MLKSDCVTGWLEKIMPEKIIFVLGLILSFIKNYVRNMKQYLISIAFGLLFCMQSPAQQIVQSIETFNLDSLLTQLSELEVDSLKYYDASIYENNWNSTALRYPATVFPDRNDTITITLVAANESQFVMPVKGQILSNFGMRHRRMHTGTDIRLNSGDTVRSAFDGKVRVAKRFNGYGNLVLVRHSNGLETIYAHLKQIKVKVNDMVKAGDLVGLGGRTGRATCNHLHFETRIFGEPFDPNKYIDLEQATLRTDQLYYKNKQVETDLKNFQRKPVLNANNQWIASVNGSSKHVISKGDTLWSIAKKYRTTVKKLCANNNISEQQKLKIGSVLQIQ